MDEFIVKKPKSYYEQAYDKIKQMIFDGVLKNGECICETKIAEQFNVSRSPVREAIRSLEKEGLLVDDGKKIKVYEPTKEDVEQIFECREGIEFIAVKLATERAAEEELKKIEQDLCEVENILKKTDFVTDKNIIMLNTRFHDLILKFSRNTRLQNQMDNLKSLIYFYRIINLNEKHRSDKIYAQHVEIFNFMKQRDSQKASESMLKHIESDLAHIKLFIDK